MAWIEVGKSDCDYCGGTGVEPGVHNLIAVEGVQSLKDRGFECRDCDGTGKRSVGYQDSRDASGR